MRYVFLRALVVIGAAACLLSPMPRQAQAQSTTPAAPILDAPKPQPDLPAAPGESVPAPMAPAAPAYRPDAGQEASQEASQDANQEVKPVVAAPPPRSTVPGFAAYENCKFPDHLTLIDRTPLVAGVTTRAAETSYGTIPVQLDGGERMLFAYPGQDLFANVKLEKLPAKNYLGQKRTLIEDFNHTLAQSPLGARNYSLPARLRGFEIYGLDRVELSGSVLGIYLFFDDLNRIATTVWLMNQDPATRPFQTIDQYAALRDQFLKNYTACIRAHQGVAVKP